MVLRRFIMKKKMFLTVLGLLMFCGMAFSAVPEFDPAIANAIFLTGLGGLGVMGASEILKRFLSNILKIDLTNGAKVIISIVVSALGTAIYMINNFVVLYFLLYTALVALIANGLYKVGHTPTE